MTRTRLLVWLVLTLGAAVTAYRSSSLAIATTLLHPLQVLNDHLVHAWGVLALCLAALWLKRRTLFPPARQRRGEQLRWAAAGAAWLAISGVLFAPAALLAGAVGLYALVCGRAARWPSVLMAVYLAAAGLPSLVERFADRPVGLVTAAATTTVLRTAGYPLARAGQDLSLVDAGGATVRVLINASCAGPATMGVFLAIFALMAMDLPLPWAPAAGLLLVGVAGTWLQNVGRLVYLLLVGYYRGEAALWAAHADSGYLWFIGWYAAFALCYIWVAGRVRVSDRGGDVPGLEGDRMAARRSALAFWMKWPTIESAGWTQPR